MDCYVLEWREGGKPEPKPSSGRCNLPEWTFMQIIMTVAQLGQVLFTWTGLE